MAAYHLWEAERHGLERGSLPWRLLHAEAVGQVLHWAVLREFVIDQRTFILNYLQYGVDLTLLCLLSSGYRVVLECPEGRACEVSGSSQSRV